MVQEVTTETDENPAAGGDTGDAGGSSKVGELAGVEGIANILRAAGADQPQADDDGEPTGGDLGSLPDDEPTLSEDGLGLQAASDADGGDSDAPLKRELAMLAEKAGLTIEELYAVEVKLGDDLEPTTLGKLKDNFRDYSKLETAQSSFDEHRTEFENDMIRSRAELQEVIKLLPQVPQELIQQAQESFQAARDTERAALYLIKPEWKDPEVFARAQDQVMETVKDYGFTRVDLDAVLDHRLTKLLHDFHTMRERFKAANAGAKKVVTGTRQSKAKATRDRANRSQSQTLSDAAADRNTSNKASAVSELLKAIK